MEIVGFVVDVTFVELVEVVLEEDDDGLVEVELVVELDANKVDVSVVEVVVVFVVVEIVLLLVEFVWFWLL